MTTTIEQHVVIEINEQRAGRKQSIAQSTRCDTHRQTSEDLDEIITETEAHQHTMVIEQVSSSKQPHTTVIEQSSTHLVSHDITTDDDQLTDKLEAIISEKCKDEQMTVDLDEIISVKQQIIGECIESRAVQDSTKEGFSLQRAWCCLMGRRTS